MILIDQRVYDSLKSQSWQRPMEQMMKNIESRQELLWKRPTDIKAKSKQIAQMKSILDDSNLEDDVKAKKYNESFMRFKQIGNKIPKEAPADDATTTAAAAPAVADDLIDLNTEIKQKAKKQKRGRKKPSGMTIFKSPIQTRSGRRVSIPKLDWLMY